jgi:hypothetical protein
MKLWRSKDWQINQKKLRVNYASFSDNDDEGFESGIFLQRKTCTPKNA